MYNLIMKDLIFADLRLQLFQMYTVSIFITHRWILPFARLQSVHYSHFSSKKFQIKQKCIIVQCRGSRMVNN